MERSGAGDRSLLFTTRPRRILTHYRPRFTLGGLLHLRLGLGLAPHFIRPADVTERAGRNAASRARLFFPGAPNLLADRLLFASSPELLFPGTLFDADLRGLLLVSRLCLASALLLGLLALLLDGAHALLLGALSLPLALDLALLFGLSLAFSSLLLRLPLQLLLLRLPLLLLSLLGLPLLLFLQLALLRLAGLLLLRLTRLLFLPAALLLLAALARLLLALLPVALVGLPVVLFLRGLLLLVVCRADVAKRGGERGSRRCGRSQQCRAQCDTQPSPGLLFHRHPSTPRWRDPVSAPIDPIHHIIQTPPQLNGSTDSDGERETAIVGRQNDCAGSRTSSQPWNGSR